MSDNAEGMAPHPVELTDELKAQLNGIATATLTMILQQKGIRSTFFSGLEPTNPQKRMLGYALTLRYVPMREDLQKELGAGVNAQRRAIEGVGPDEVIVIEARSKPDAGTCGDIFATRAMVRGSTGLVTDGALRDDPGVSDIDWPVYRRSAHAATLSRQHLPLEVNVPVTCSDVLVMPGDIIVGDAEGAMVVPSGLVVEVAERAAEIELRETWALERVAAGESSIGVFSVAENRLAEYEAWKAARG